MWDYFEVEAHDRDENVGSQWLAAALVEDILTVGTGESKHAAADDLRAQLGALPPRSSSDEQSDELFQLVRMRALRTMQVRLKRRR
jgi:hypothetical protein